MMNRIGIRAEDRIGSREPWFGDHRATSVPEHGRADPGGSTVRGSRWPGWRRATGMTCGRRAPPGSASTRPSTTTRSPPPATSASAAASAGPSGPSSAPPPPAADGRPHRTRETSPNGLIRTSPGSRSQPGGTGPAVPPCGTSRSDVRDQPFPTCGTSRSRRCRIPPFRHAGPRCSDVQNSPSAGRDPAVPTCRTQPFRPAGPPLRRAGPRRSDTRDPAAPTRGTPARPG